MKKTVLFGHATGVPAKVYEEFFEEMGNSFQWEFINKIGHNPDFPIEGDWNGPLNEIEAFLEEKSFDGTLIGIGHSLGGMLNFLTELRRPGTFSHLVLIDSPLLMGFEAFAYGVAKKIGQSDHFTPAKKSRKRTTFWESKEMAKIYLEKNPFFKRFSAKSRQLFFDHGICPDQGEGLRLAFDLEIELKLFRTLPHTLDKKSLKSKPKMIYLRAKKGPAVPPKSYQKFIEKFKMETMEFEGGHMAPLENPGQMAKIVNQWLEKNGASLSS